MQTRARGRFDVAELVIGIALLALAALILFDARRLPAGVVYGIGPGVAPVIVAGGLIVLGLATIAAAFWRAPWVEEDEGEAGGAVDWTAVVVIVVSLAALIALMMLGAGFILGCTVLFAGTAWAFGRRSPLADIAIGFALALVIHVVFTRLLTLTLPEGPIERLLLRGLAG